MSHTDTHSRITAAQILDLLADLQALEKLYRREPQQFKTALAEAREQRPDAIVLKVWEARFSDTGITKSVPTRLFQTLALALATGVAVRVPAIWLGEDWYYPRFGPMLVMISLVAYFWLQSGSRFAITLVTFLGIGSVVWVSVLPEYTDSVVMAIVHLPLLWWAAVGLAFAGSGWRSLRERIDFIRYNGELLILATLVAISGLVFSGITGALFDMTMDGAGDWGEWYMENLGLMGAASVPVMATFLYDTVFRRHTGIPPVLAQVFTPLFLVMLIAYLVTALISGQNAFVDREFLVIVNGLLLVVLGMTVLSIAERGASEAVLWTDRTNMALLAVTLLVDLMALSAILFRLTMMGLTPNRVVVLGANLVILAHLVTIFRTQVKFVRGAVGSTAIMQAATRYLPVYAAWAAFVCFILPIVFGFA